MTTIRTLIAALPLAIVLSGCGGSVTAPQQVDTMVDVSSPAFTIAPDTLPRDTSSRTGGTMGSGN